MRLPYFLLLFALAFAIHSCDECANVECANGGTCYYGVCRCDDGIDRSFCEKDTCLLTDKCVNGSCEYGFCVCDEYWTGEACDSLTYIDHSGDFFGAYECNETFVLTGNIIVETTALQDSIRIIEPDINYIYYAGFTDLNSFTIPTQQVADDGDEFVTVQGSGTVFNKTLKVNLIYRTFSNGFATISTCYFEGERTGL